MTNAERTKSFAKGNIGEKVTKEFFLSKNYIVTPATLDQQVNGHWDFRAVNKKKDLLIEVKTDFAAAKTKNVFLETEVGDSVGFMGKIQPDSPIIFCFCFPQAQELAFIRSSNLLDIDLAKLHFRRFTHPSNTYSAGGYLLPKSDFISYCHRIYCWEVDEQGKKTFAQT